MHNLNLILWCYGGNNLIASLQYCKLVADCYDNSTEDTEKMLFTSIFEDIQNHNTKIGLEYANDLIVKLELELEMLEMGY